MNEKEFKLQLKNYFTQIDIDNILMTIDEYFKPYCSYEKKDMITLLACKNLFIKNKRLGVLSNTNIKKIREKIIRDFDKQSKSLVNEAIYNKNNDLVELENSLEEFIFYFIDNVDLSNYDISFIKNLPKSYKVELEKNLMQWITLKNTNYENFEKYTIQENISRNVIINLVSKISNELKIKQNIQPQRKEIEHILKLISKSELLDAIDEGLQISKEDRQMKDFYWNLMDVKIRFRKLEFRNMEGVISFSDYMRNYKYVCNLLTSILFSEICNEKTANSHNIFKLIKAYFKKK